MRMGATVARPGGSPPVCGCAGCLVGSLTGAYLCRLRPLILVPPVDCARWLLGSVRAGRLAREITVSLLRSHGWGLDCACGLREVSVRFSSESGQGHCLDLLRVRSPTGVRL